MHHFLTFRKSLYAASAALAVTLMLLSGCDSGDKAKPEPLGEEGVPQVVERAPLPKEIMPPGAGDTARGKLIYEKHCHFCHGRQGLGDGPVGIAVSPHPADFVNDTKRMKKTDEELFESLSMGIRKELGGEEMAMPSWKGTLSAEERRDVISYIRQLSAEGKKKKITGK